tara:strand:- start:2929 stop:3540 length:612 start_codon:yes stop_codon:yes gene_type:complete
MISRRFFLTGALGALAWPALYPAMAIADVPQPARRLVESAKRQIGTTLQYDGAYARLDYPGGDVPMIRGVCSDVVIRAYRDGLGIDLQELVHEDMGAHFSAYPANWGLTRPDRNIDHRRVPNLATFFRRQGAKLGSDAAYEPGDLVTQMVGGSLPHIVIVSSEKIRDMSRYKVIHNIGGGTVFADGLKAFPITGHYRYFGSRV